MYFLYKVCFFCEGSKLSNSNDGKFSFFFLFFVGGLKKVLVWGERSGC